MADARFDVLTIGNAIVDVIAPIDAGFLEREGMSEGIMHLVDAERSAYLYERMPAEKRMISGGSAANTAAGVASLGGRAAFIGKVADDDLGDIFADDLARIGVHYGVSRLTDGPATARSMILALAGRRADDEHLSRRLPPADDRRHQGRRDRRRPPSPTWKATSGIRSRPRRPSSRAAHYAHKHERATSFTLSDPFCVNRYRDEFLDLMRSKTIDYVFANVEELKSLYQTDFHNSVQAIAKDVELAAITMGAEGAMVVANGEVISVPAYAVDQSSTRPARATSSPRGSSWRWRAGRSRDGAQAGCLAASEVISHIGARPVLDLAGAGGREHGVAIVTDRAGHPAA